MGRYHGMDTSSRNIRKDSGNTKTPRTNKIGKAANEVGGLSEEGQKETREVMRWKKAVLNKVL